MKKPMDKEILLEVKNLHKKFPVKEGIFSRAKSFIHSVNGIGFKVRKKRTLGIVGESGSGKSTVARLIMRLIEADEGEVLLQGENLFAMDKRALREKRLAMQMIFQSPAESLNQRFTVEEIIREPLDINRIGDSASRTKRVRELLDCVGLSRKSINRYAFEFSGGQRQRIGIARALATSPVVLIADEAVSALDISVQAQILNLLLDLQEDLGIGYVMISHDLNVIRHVSDEMLVMYLGRVVEQGETASVINRPVHPYTKALLESIPDFESKTPHVFKPVTGEIPSLIDVPPGCAFRNRCPIAKERCSRFVPHLEPVGRQTNHRVACPYSL